MGKATVFRVSVARGQQVAQAADRQAVVAAPPPALAMVSKLARSAERHWRRPNGSERLAQVIQGVRFRGGAPVTAAEDQAAA